MPITKAIIPVAGWGTRRLPITKIIEKSMLPVGNRPLVDYSVQELIKAGIKDIYMVISDVEPCQVREFYRDNLALNQYLIDRGKEDRLALAKTLPDDVTIHYTVQDPSGKYGTAVPVSIIVKEFNINEQVILFMGDDILWNPGRQSSAELLISSVQSPTDSVIAGMRVPKEDISKFGVIALDGNKMTGIVEKPDPEEAPSDISSIGRYVLSPELLKTVVEYVDNNDFGPQDQEYMITDPIDEFIKNGGTMRVAISDGEFLDGGSLEGWVHANNVVCGNN